MNWKNAFNASKYRRLANWFSLINQFSISNLRKINLHSYSPKEGCVLRNSKLELLEDCVSDWNFESLIFRKNSIKPTKITQFNRTLKTLGQHSVPSIASMPIEVYKQPTKNLPTTNTPPSSASPNRWAHLWNDHRNLIKSRLFIFEKIAPLIKRSQQGLVVC